MRISHMIAELQTIFKEHGDLEMRVAANICPEAEKGVDAPLEHIMLVAEDAGEPPTTVMVCDEDTFDTYNCPEEIEDEALANT